MPKNCSREIEIMEMFLIGMNRLCKTIEIEANKLFIKLYFIQKVPLGSK